MKRFPCHMFEGVLPAGLIVTLSTAGSRCQIQNHCGSRLDDKTRDYKIIVDWGSIIEHEITNNFSIFFMIVKDYIKAFPKNVSEFKSLKARKLYVKIDSGGLTRSLMYLYLSDACPKRCIKFFFFVNSKCKVL